MQHRCTCQSILIWRLNFVHCCGLTAAVRSAKSYLKEPSLIKQNHLVWLGCLHDILIWHNNKLAHLESDVDSQEAAMSTDNLQVNRTNLLSSYVIHFKLKMSTVHSYKPALRKLRWTKFSSFQHRYRNQHVNLMI